MHELSASSPDDVSGQNIAGLGLASRSQFGQEGGGRFNLETDLYASGLSCLRRSRLCRSKLPLSQRLYSRIKRVALIGLLSG